YFCCTKCRAKFRKDPKEYTANLAAFANGAADGVREGVRAPATIPSPAPGATIAAKTTATSAADAEAIQRLLFGASEEDVQRARRQIRLACVPRPSLEGRPGHEIDDAIRATWRAT